MNLYFIATRVTYRYRYLNNFPSRRNLSRGIVLTRNKRFLKKYNSSFGLMIHHTENKSNSFLIPTFLGLISWETIWRVFQPYLESFRKLPGSSTCGCDRMLSCISEIRRDRSPMQVLISSVHSSAVTSAAVIPLAGRYY